MSQSFAYAATAMPAGSRRDSKGEAERLRRLFLVEIAPWMRSHLGRFAADGAWLDEEFGERAVRRRALQRCRVMGWRGRARFGRRMRAVRDLLPEHDPLLRIEDALSWAKASDDGQTASPTSAWSRRVLLIAWLALDADAGATSPRVTALQDFVTDHVPGGAVSPDHVDDAFFLDAGDDRPWRRCWSWRRPRWEDEPHVFIALMTVAESAWAQPAPWRDRPLTPDPPHTTDGPADADEAARGDATAAAVNSYAVRSPDRSVPERALISQAELVRFRLPGLSRSTILRARNHPERPLWSERRNRTVYLDIREVARRWPTSFHGPDAMGMLERAFPRLGRVDRVPDDVRSHAA